MESIQHITPRWEWRIFSEEPQEAVNQLQDLTLLRTVESFETYLLLPDSDFNLKIRNDQFEIKQLIERSPDLLEKWMPIFKSAFPIIDFDWSPWTSLTEHLNDLNHHTFNQSKELIQHFKDRQGIQIVNIRKLRQVYGHGMTHFDSVIINLDDGRAVFSLACEDENPNRLREWVDRLGFQLESNRNYVQALKRLTG